MTTCTGASAVLGEAGPRPAAEENCAYVRELFRERHPWFSAALEFLVLDVAAAAGVPVRGLG